MSLPVKVIGVGGYGCNSVDYLIQSGLKEVDFICADAESDTLKHSLSSWRIQLGSIGLGVGSNVERGQLAAIEASQDISSALTGAKVLVIAAGIAGGTGGGGARIIANLARKLGVITIVAATAPFSFEGQRRSENASRTLEFMDDHADMTMVISNNRLLEVLDDEVSQETAFVVSSDVLKSAVLAIQDFNTTGSIFEALTRIRGKLRRRGCVMMGHGTGRGPYRVASALERAMDF